MIKTKLVNLTKETESVELKSSLSAINEIIETVSAFANTNGGKIVVGVNDAGKVIGVEIGKGTLENLANQIAQGTDPKVHPTISVKEIESKKIIVIEVKESLDRLVLAFGRPFKRVGKSCQKVGKDEYERLILEKHKDKLQFDSQICKGADLSKDIDQRKIRTYLKLREKNRKISAKIKIPVNQLLMNVKAAVGDKPSNAGILFFGKNPLRFISQAQLRLVRIKGIKIYGNILDRLDCEGTLWEMVDDAEDFLRKSIRLLGFRTDKSFRREDRFEYPIRALREAIINGLIHRDYRSLADVRVFIFDDRVEIASPGSFPEGVTPQKPIHKPVNKILSDLMYDIGYIEKYGSGIRLENELCRENKNPKPIYELDPIETKVIFKSQVKDITVVELDEEILKGLNERQKKAVDYVKEKGSIARNEYMKINKISHKTAHLELKDLLGKKLFLQEGKGRATKYLLRG